MTHDKVRQDFEVYKAGALDAYGMWNDKLYCSHEAAFQAGDARGRAAERAEIREKLESEGMVETIATALINGLRFHKGCTTAVTGTHAMLDDDAESYKAEAEAAITKILEVI